VHDAEEDVADQVDGQEDVETKGGDEADGHL
jgi:hypothetical protein